MGLAGGLVGGEIEVAGVPTVEKGPGGREKGVAGSRASGARVFFEEGNRSIFPANNNIS